MDKFTLKGDFKECEFLHTLISSHFGKVLTHIYPLLSLPLRLIGTTEVTHGRRAAGRSRMIELYPVMFNQDLERMMLPALTSGVWVEFTLDSGNFQTYL